MEKSYCETDPDSYEAYYEPDPGDPKGLVEVKDKALTFTWYRGKSNENLTDTREGKEGFSFYLARHAYYDIDRIIDNSLATDKNCTGIIGIVEKSDNKLMIVINVKPDEDDDYKIHIVSAYYTYEPKIIKQYNIQKKQNERIREAIAFQTDDELARLHENIERRNRYIESLNLKKVE